MDCSLCGYQWSKSNYNKSLYRPEYGFLIDGDVMLLCIYCDREKRQNLLKRYIPFVKAIKYYNLNLYG